MDACAYTNNVSVSLIGSQNNSAAPSGPIDTQKMLERHNRNQNTLSLWCVVASCMQFEKPHYEFESTNIQNTHTHNTHAMHSRNFQRTSDANFMFRESNRQTNLKQKQPHVNAITNTQNNNNKLIRLIRVSVFIATKRCTCNNFGAQFVAYGMMGCSKCRVGKR